MFVNKTALLVMFYRARARTTRVLDYLQGKISVLPYHFDFTLIHFSLIAVLSFVYFDFWWE